jgi:hypothetical protein
MKGYRRAEEARRGLLSQKNEAIEQSIPLTCGGLGEYCWDRQAQRKADVPGAWPGGLRLWVTGADV